MIVRMAPPRAAQSPSTLCRFSGPLIALCLFLASTAFWTLGALPACSQEFIPRKQSRVPGPPLTPQEAITRMQVPEGFRVELVASEPQIMHSMIAAGSM
jgi:hypothetical protein